MKRSMLVPVLCFALLYVPCSVFGAEKEYDAALKEYAAGKYERAADHLRYLVNKKPDPAAYYLLGYSLYKLGKFGEANQFFDQAYLIDPDFSPEKAGLSKDFPKIAPKRAKPAVRKHGVKKPAIANAPQHHAPAVAQKAPATAISAKPVAAVSPNPAPKHQQDKPSAAAAQKNQASVVSAKPTAAAAVNAAAKDKQEKPSAMSGQNKQASAAAVPPQKSVAPEKKSASMQAKKASIGTGVPQNVKAESGILTLIKDPMVIAGIAAIFATLLLGAGGLYYLRRKRKIPDLSFPEPSPFDADSNDFLNDDDFGRKG